MCPDQLVVVFRLQLPQAEGMSGNLRRSAFLTPDVLPLPCFLSSFFSFLHFTVFFSQKRGFPLKAGGSPAILAAKTWQYLLKYGWCGVCFVFVVISLLHCFLWPSLAIFGRVFSIVVLVYSYRCSFYRCGDRNFSPLHLTRSHRRVALLRGLALSLHSRHPFAHFNFSF